MNIVCLVEICSLWIKLQNSSTLGLTDELSSILKILLYFNTQLLKVKVLYIPCDETLIT